jgi:hypothetical protein
MRGRGERIERMDDSNKTTQQEGDSTLENDIITQCIDTQEKKGKERNLKEKRAIERALLCCSPAMELLQRLSVPRRRDARDVVKVLVRARIA